MKNNLSHISKFSKNDWFFPEYHNRSLPRTYTFDTLFWVSSWSTECVNETFDAEMGVLKHTHVPPECSWYAPLMKILRFTAKAVNVLTLWLMVAFVRLDARDRSVRSSRFHSLCCLQCLKIPHHQSFQRQVFHRVTGSAEHTPVDPMFVDELRAAL